MFSIAVINVSYLIVGLFVLNFIIALSIIFIERKDPSATLAWIMILFLIPLVGILLYVFLSQNFSKKKIFKMNKYEETVLREAMKEQTRAMENGDFVFQNNSALRWKDMIRLHQTYADAFFTEDNEVKIIHDGEDLMEHLLNEIKGAKESINIMYYIIKNDEVGKKFIRALTEKAREGLKVRLLMDALGCRQITHAKLEDFKNAGGEYSYFFPPKFKWLNMKLNYRNHRKIVIIDRKTGFLGGYNIAREYLGRKKKFGYWRDTHIRLVGGSVQDLFARFILDWRCASKDEIVMTEAYFDEPIHKGFSGIQIVSSGPESQKEEVKQGYLKMISSAERNIYIQTPYFVPDSSILDSLKMAILSGVDVRLMIPCKPDHMFVYWATYSYIGILLEMGAKVFIYDNGFLHAKTISVDGEVASVGSANFDIRSFRLNFEVNAFIYDENVAKNLEDIFEDDIKVCTELTKHAYINRSIVIKFKESISRLLSDLL